MKCNHKNINPKGTKKEKRKNKWDKVNSSKSGRLKPSQIYNEIICKMV